MRATSAAEEKPIGRLAAAERNRFLAEFRLTQPVVLTGGLAHWRDTLFDLKRLAGRFGTEPVLSYKLPPDETASRMSSVKSNFYMWSDKEGDREHLREWTFGEFLEALARGEPHYCMANGSKNTRLRGLLAAEAGEFGCIPGDGAQQSPAGREFFFGSASAGPGLHHDGPIESFLCQLIGPKQVNVFSPADIPYLYPADSWLAPTGHFSAIADSFSADTRKFPLFRHATVYSCALEPGDVLYLPPHWYHDTAPRGPTVTMTIRNTPPAAIWGGPQEQGQLREAASALSERLAKFSQEARAVYSALLVSDLDAGSRGRFDARAPGSSREQRIFEAMRANLDLAKGLARNESAYWRTCLERKKRWLDEGVANPRIWREFRSNVISGALDNANAYRSGPLRERVTNWIAMRLLHRLAKRELAPAYWKYLAEIPVGKPRMQPIGGIPVSKSSLEFSVMFSRLLPRLADCKVLVEIGGGYGGLARIVKDAFPGIKYVILDLPEVGAIQTYYLGMSSAHSSIGGMRDVDRSGALDPRKLDFDYLLLPPQFIEHLAPQSVDLFINTRSMMEMDIGTVGHYFEHIQRTIRVGGGFYCLNRYAKLCRFKDYPYDDRWYVEYSRPWPRCIDINPHHELLVVRSPAAVAAGGVTQILRDLPPAEPRRT